MYVDSDTISEISTVCVDSNTISETSSTCRNFDIGVVLCSARINTVFLRLTAISN